MLDHGSGMIGLPLRLLAREVYDRVSARVGERAVALVTGEEKRVPPRPSYWVCTVEAMPQDREVDFLAVDEIQLATHPQRGHVFTQRLLGARGRVETWFMGSETMRPLVERLLPTARFRSHPRLSRLKHAGSLALRALPPRSAIVAFSVPQVYELAEKLRHHRGGAAVVLGALSPRTRNAQVALYQAGEVDYLVATDAIGMGLNLDVEHVAFAATQKFDGRETRPLEAAELAQIAGRAGRYLNDGSFGTLAPVPAFPDPLADAIEHHRFVPERSVWWRNADQDFSSPAALLASLREKPRRSELKLAETPEDGAVLEHLLGFDEIRLRADSSERLGRLWDVCQIPNFGGFTVPHHGLLLAEVFRQLADRGGLDPDWLEASISRIENVRGDIDTLMMRIELIRTWTYISHRPGWITRPEGWQERTRVLEERLSDALHERLVERFVAPGQKLAPRARRRPRSINEPSAEETRPKLDHPFGKLLEMKLKLAPEPLPSAAQRDDEWAHELVDAPFEAFRVDREGRVLSDNVVLGRMTRGGDLLRPEVKLTADGLGAGARARLQRRLVAWTRDLVADLFAPLRSQRAQAFSSSARGLIYQLEQGLGTLPSARAKVQLAALSRGDRELFAELGVVLGHRFVFADWLLDASALIRRAALQSAWTESAGQLLRANWARLGSAPTSFGVEGALDAERFLELGYPLVGKRAVRVDVLERVGKTLHQLAHQAEFELPASVSNTLGSTDEEACELGERLGYRRIGPRRFLGNAGRPARKRRARGKRSAASGRPRPDVP
jgi:ATP-dependent RNA helicase SUPV3L1/SUV3